jgi:membrane associated rhomboid family serine protease
VARRGGGLPRIFTFGDRVPATLGLVLALMLAASVWGWLDRTGTVRGLVALAPEEVLHGQLWRLVTWPFVQEDPFALLFGGFMLYWLGQQLSFVWSERRFLLRFFAYAAFATVATTLLALVWPAVGAVRPHVGIWPVANALLVSWAMLYPDRQVNIWGVLPVTGRTIAWLVLGGTFLYGIAGGGIFGIAAFAPHLFALGLAWLLARGGGRYSPWRDARTWWAEQSARRRARHLKVVKKDGEEDRPRWLN